MLDYLGAIRKESDAFYAAAAKADPDGAVPSCPEWKVRDLVTHFAGVHFFWALIIEKKVTDLEQLHDVEEPTPPDDYLELVALGETMVDRLIDALSATDPATPVWSWSKQQDVAFTLRHQVQEAAVHRWDIENATDTPGPIDADIAVDSIDEFLRLSLPSRNDWKPPMDTIHIHAADTGDDWFIEPGGNVEARGGSADVTIQAPASDVLLGLYGRIPLDGVEALLGGLAFS